MIYVIVDTSTGKVVNVITADDSIQVDTSIAHYNWKTVKLADVDAPAGLTAGWDMKPSGVFTPPPLTTVKEVATKFVSSLFYQIQKDHPDVPAQLLTDALTAIDEATTSEQVSEVMISTDLKPPAN